MHRFRLLVLRRILRAPLRSLMTVATIGAGVALAVSISILVASIDRSLGDLGRDLAGPAPLRIAGATMRGGLPEEAVDRAAQVEGVEAVVPMVQTTSRIQSAPGGDFEPVLVLGVDCRVEALFGSFGCDPDAVAAGFRVVGEPVAELLGPDAVLRTDLGRLPLAGAPVVDALGGLGDGRVVVLGLPEAQAHLTRQGRVDVAYVMVEPAADEAAVAELVQEAVGSHLPVLPGSAPPAGSDAVLGAALPIFSLLGIFALGIGAVLVANTAAMALESRRRELAVLGALGGRRRTIGGGAVIEMGLLGAAGGVVGALGGAAVASPIVASLSSFTERIAGVSLRTHVGPGAVLLGVVLGAGLGAAATILPARRATALDVAAELSGRDPGDTAKPPRLGRRLLLWGGASGLGLGACWVAQRDGGLEPWQAALVTPAFLVVAIGLLFTTAAAAPLLARLLGGAVGRTTSAPLRLAVAAASRDHRRTGVLVVAVSAAIATAFVTEGSSASARASIESSFSRGGPAVDVATVPSDEGAGPGLTPDLLAALGGVAGVGEVTSSRLVISDPEGTPTLVLALVGDQLLEDVIDGEADAGRLAGGEVLVGAGLARAQGIRAGDDVELVTPWGPRSLPVQGVWEDGNNVGMNVRMSPELLVELYGEQPPAWGGARPAPGVAEAELVAAIEAAGLDAELETRTSMEVATDIADQVDAQFTSFRVMQRALLVVLFVAVLSSLALAGVQRRRELGLLGAVGADPRHLAGILLAEGALVATLGIALSVAVAPTMMWTMNQVLPFVVGFRNPLTFDWGSLVVTSAVAVPLVLAGAAFPARRAARVEVLDALRSE